MLNISPSSPAKPKPSLPARKRGSHSRHGGRIKRKRGGQPGNLNARKHGLYSSKKPHPKTLLFKVSPSKVKLAELGKHDAGQVELFKQELDSNRALLGVLTAFTKNAKTTGEMLAWTRQIGRIIGADLKLITAIYYLEKPKKDLLVLARFAHHFVQWEFMDRGIPEQTIFVPMDFDNFCAHPDSTLEKMTDNTIIVSTRSKIFVPQDLNNFRANLTDSGLRTVPSPFLTDQQWFLIGESFRTLKNDLDQFRKYKRRKPRFSTRLLFEAVLIKLALNLRWEDLDQVIYTYHPDLASFPLRACQKLYKNLFNSGRLQAIYKQLHWHLAVYGETNLEELVEQDCFQLGKKDVTLAPGQALTWQLFTALLLLQRTSHNYRALAREVTAQRRLEGRYYRFPSRHRPHTKKSSVASPSFEQIFSRPPLPEPSTFEPLVSSQAAKKWQAHEKLENAIQSRPRSSVVPQKSSGQKPAPQKTPTKLGT